MDHILYDLLSRRVEGIIWAVPADVNTFDWLAEKFSKIKTPLVYINKGPNGPDHVTALDNRLGGKLLPNILYNKVINGSGSSQAPEVGGKHKSA